MQKIRLFFFFFHFCFVWEGHPNVSQTSGICLDTMKKTTSPMPQSPGSVPTCIVSVSFWQEPVALCRFLCRFRAEQSR